jgi:hypothetical protein
MRRAFILCVVSSVLGGCSTADSYINRPTTYDGLPQGIGLGYTPRMATLSLNSDRRLMISDLQKHTTCSEPPPDTAVSLLAKSALKGDLKTPSTSVSGVDLSDEFHSDAALIAYRNAAVEFWRTTSFEYCQLLMNGMDDKAADYLKAAQAIAPEFAPVPAKGQGGDTAKDQPPPPPTMPTQPGEPKQKDQNGSK